ADLRLARRYRTGHKTARGRVRNDLISCSVYTVWPGRSTRITGLFLDDGSAGHTEDTAECNCVFSIEKQSNRTDVSGGDGSGFNITPVDHGRRIRLVDAEIKKE